MAGRVALEAVSMGCPSAFVWNTSGPCRSLTDPCHVALILSVNMSDRLPILYTFFHYRVALLPYRDQPTYPTHSIPALYISTQKPYCPPRSVDLVHEVTCHKLSRDWARRARACPLLAEVVLHIISAHKGESRLTRMWMP